MGTLHEDQYTFMIMSCSFILRTGNLSENLVEKFKTHISPLVSIFFFENCVDYKILPQDMVESDRPQTTIWYSACVFYSE
jgi:hypothetical protein